MKKFIFLLPVLLMAIPLVCLLPAKSMAEATSTPHIVVSGDVWLLSESGEKLFLLPDTYYARINNLDENYYYVTFNGVNGKVVKTAVSTVGYHASATGTTRDMTISGEYSEFVAINLKKAPDIGAENACQVPLGETITYIGSYPTDGALWYYAQYNGSYGYVKAERTSMTTVSIPAFVPETLPVEETPEADDTDKTVLDKLDDTELKIVIIVGLAIPAVAVVVLLFRPAITKRRNKKETYYDD